MSDTDAVAVAAVAAAERVAGHEERTGASLFFNARLYPSAEASAAEPSSAAASSDAAAETDLRCTASWMIVGEDGRVVETGDDANVPSDRSMFKQCIDMEGRTVLPGLIDAHIHVLMTGRFAFQVDMRGCTSIEAFQQRLREGIKQQDEERVASATPAASSVAAASEPQQAQSEEWIVGIGWEQDELGRYPTRADIDAVEPNRPVLLWRICSHICLVNSAALRAAGIDASTVAPSGGSLDYSTGMLREIATQMVAPFLKESPAIIKRNLRRGLEMCSRFGLTAVQTNDEESWLMYKELAEEGDKANGGALPLRVFLTIQQSEIGLSGRPIAGETCGPLLESHRVKLFADGALGAQTASLSKPYVEVPHRCAGIHGKHAADHEHNDDGGAAAAVASSSSDAASSSSSPNYGLLIHTSAALKDKVSFAHSKGWRLEVHVIGDRAAEEALAAFESSGITAKDRPIMTHCQVLREDLVERMRAIGAIADVQPQFSVTDSKWASERLPDELLQWSYCWRTLLKRGVHVAGGSDAPIEVANPLLGMHAAIFRPVQQYDLDQTGGQAKQSKETEQPLPPITPDQRWRPSECLSVRESLALYTTGAAYAAGRENELGVLRRGFWADFTVLDRDVVQNPLELVRARVEQVYVAGLRKK